jgi:hypothetical protein
MLQHVLVLSLVVFCLAYVVRQAIATLRLRKGNLGSCCSKGCSAGDTPPSPKSQFLPADLLIRKR